MRDRCRASRSLLALSFARPYQARGFRRVAAGADGLPHCTTHHEPSGASELVSPLHSSGRLRRLPKNLVLVLPVRRSLRARSRRHLARPLRMPSPPSLGSPSQAEPWSCLRLSPLRFRTHRFRFCWAASRSASRLKLGTLANNTVGAG
jgi:hypothetical protein